MLHSIQVPTDRWRWSEASEWPQSLERVEHSGAIGPGGQSATFTSIGLALACSIYMYMYTLSHTSLYYRNATVICV